MHRFSPIVAESRGRRILARAFKQGDVQLRFTAGGLTPVDSTGEWREVRHTGA